MAREQPLRRAGRGSACGLSPRPAGRPIIGIAAILVSRYPRRVLTVPAMSRARAVPGPRQQVVTLAGLGWIAAGSGRCGIGAGVASPAGSALTPESGGHGPSATAPTDRCSWPRTGRKMTTIRNLSVNANRLVRSATWPARRSPPAVPERVICGCGCACVQGIRSPGTVALVIARACIRPQRHGRTHHPHVGAAR
jgi:hypothetical protein